ncbi:sigma-54-dependent transcriptional regulator [Solemya velum gill symbiont]|uniref:sigma-54-dependent transcriptional regulator n=1 Tax=Solemya velum gill symbiont TaxID=2340 RepID=UPI000998B135|nr:sigma-54 dependent transcriptional regulator [Solemya velum gill symbiont]OOY98964.1 DNA-binding response regulator [Solemya velum gill symbiont]OOZ01231.1 DNA-binding response regulator [Solemya velum gill symbiont]OOZ03442.1 DNA-binding response regulator [Solemya velum gill symbiont]OOZ05696.1 DNA-binding response regulator [Solemya velum gill symbiont]OOZ07922.1 DNA-binding response regulator [Solemya velum gill symbiont]
MTQIILVDDEAPVRESASQSLKLAGFDVLPFDNAADALAQISDSFDGALITDIRMPGIDGFELMRQVIAIDKDIPVILISGHADVSTAVAAIREGGYDLLEKPFPSSELVDTTRRAVEKRRLSLENRELRQELEESSRIGPRILGKAPAIESLRRTIARIANTDTDVLIIGETGTGKELVARSLHEHSQRRNNNFVAINCGAIPEQLLDSELFGHEAGAFTDAKAQRVGKFEHANGETLFLDEIESMPLSTQVPILRVLQERSIERLGSNQQIELDLRVVTAAKIDLKEAAERGEFREDLYYRLNVLTLELPPLRERREDIPLLFQHFLLVASARCESEVPPLSAEALHTLMGHDWPGNIRELRNIAERYVLMREEFNYDLAALMQSGDVSGGVPLPEQVACFEKAMIEQSLLRHKGNIKETMEALGLPRKTLSDKMQKYQLDRKRYRDSEIE